MARIDGLKDADQGLSKTEVAERLEKYGRNMIVEASSSGWNEILYRTIKDPMTWFLVGAALLYVWLGNYTEAAILAAALLPIMGMDSYLHHRTQASTEGLSSRLASQACALRDGIISTIPAEEIVPGDIVVVTAGSYFPADGVILAGENLQADESTLTGEALPVRKSIFTGILHGVDEVPVENAYLGMAGTRLLTGEARVLITGTGADTLYGEIARLSQVTHTEHTPLQEAIIRLVRILVVVALVLCVVLATVRYVQGYGMADAILSAVTLAIAALPEEFLVVFSFFLGVGVYRLAKQQALVRRAVVVENIGRITCIGTDKTGTLTEGKLTFGDSLPAEGFDRTALLKVAAMASRVESGDPLDLMLLDAVPEFGATHEAVFPFTENRRREVAIMRETSGEVLVAMKGAPETVIQMTNLSEENREAWRQRTRDLADSGQKIIAVAMRRLPNWTDGEPSNEFEIVGLLAFTDPVRPGVVKAVEQAQSAGVRIIMITGDHEQTAAAIAREIGIGGKDPRVINGTEMAARLAAGERTTDIDVVARCTPSQKLDLVRALRQEGELVAVTGDGVNDAPALRGADIGIAMGERGTRSAREVASIVLLDDNFGTIIRAMREGRQLFVNLKLSFSYLLMIHVPLVLTAALVPLLGYPLLYLPVHIVWLELIIHPTALLVFQQLPSTENLEPVRRNTRTRFFTPFEWGIIGFVGLFTTLVIVSSYIVSFGEDVDALHARSMAMAVLIFTSAGITASLGSLGSRITWIVVGTTIASGFVAIQISPVANLLHLSPLHATDWLIVVITGVSVSVTAAFIRKKGPRQRARS